MAKTKSSLTQKKKCENCHRELAIKNNFYTTRNKLFPDGRINICKKCINEKIDYDNMNTVYDMLRQMDIPFIQSVWDGADVKKKGTKFGNYIQAIALAQYDGLTWNDSDILKSNKNKEKDKKQEVKIMIPKSEKEIKKIQNIRNRWGDDWTDEELLLLNQTYDELSADKNMKFNSSKQYLKLATMNYVRAYMASKNGDMNEADKYTKLFNETMKMGEFTPSALAKNSNLEKLGSFSDFNLMVEECIDVVDLQRILPNYMQQPRDLPDKVMWYMINYMQDSLGMKRSDYKDIYKFYIEMEANYRNLSIEEVMKEYPLQSTINDYLNDNNDLKK